MPKETLPQLNFISLQKDLDSTTYHQVLADIIKFGLVKKNNPKISNNKLFNEKDSLETDNKSEKSKDFTDDLLKKSGIVLVPGIGFGKYGEGFFRLSAVATDEQLKEVFERMKTDGFTFN